MPMKNPPHPGDLIRTEIIEALGLNVSKAAEILKVRRATLSDLLQLLFFEISWSNALGAVRSSNESAGATGTIQSGPEVKRLPGTNLIC